MIFCPFYNKECVRSTDCAIWNESSLSCGFNKTTSLLTTISEGAMGIEGPTGPQGPPGEQGIQGTPGPQGEQGIQGIQGEQGITGTAGQDSVVPGPQGPQGIQGNAGTPGAKGDTGDTGAPGTTEWAGINNKPSTFPPETHNHDAAYEAKNSNIQTHVGSAHAPAGAQVNADITKAEIEAKLTGTISSHSHAGGGGQPIGFTILANDTLAQALATNINTQITVTAARTLTTTVPAAGTRCSVMVLTAATSSYVITFGTGFKPVSTLATGTTTARVFVVNFISNGTVLYEAGRTAAMVA
jgi:hypothetical protein